MPSMNVRWAKKNKTMIGSMLITVAAMIQAKLLKPYAPRILAMPNETVYNDLSLR